MPSLKETKARIGSVRNTLKITTAMKMVSSAKLHHAQAAIGNMLPYESQLHSILAGLLASEKAGSPLLSSAAEASPRVAVVAISSSSSLCGAFNSNVARRLSQLSAEIASEECEMELYAVGKKICEASRKAGFSPIDDFVDFADEPSFGSAARMAEVLSGRFLKGEVRKVIFLYNHFASTASQPTVVSAYLPLILPKDTEGGLSLEDFIVEPSPEEMIGILIPKVMKLKLYTVLLDASAAEHAARVVAMQTASDNADKLLQELTLEYNKRRQQAITNEILDIVSGSMA